MLALTDLFASMNAQWFVRFEPVQNKKRVENKVAGGTLTLGVAASPVVWANRLTQSAGDERRGPDPLWREDPLPER